MISGSFDRNVVRLVAPLLFVPLAVACEDPAKPDTEDDPVAAAIEISGDTVAQRGVPFELSAVVRDDAGNVLEGEPVTWTSLDVHAATVDAGLVTPTDIGYVVIRAAQGDASAEHRVRIGLGAADQGTLRVRFAGEPGAAWTPDAIVETDAFGPPFMDATLRGVAPAGNDEIELYFPAMNGRQEEAAGPTDPGDDLDAFLVVPDGSGGVERILATSSGYVTLESDFPARPGNVPGSTRGWGELRMYETWPDDDGDTATVYVAFDVPFAWRTRSAVFRFHRDGTSVAWIPMSLEDIEATVDGDRVALSWTEESYDVDDRARRTIGVLPIAVDSFPLQAVERDDFEAGAWPDVFSWVEREDGAAGSATWGYIEVTNYLAPTAEYSGAAYGLLHAEHELYDGDAVVATDSIVRQFMLTIPPTGN